MAYCIPDIQENTQGLPFLNPEGEQIFNTYKTTKYSKLLDALIGQIFIGYANTLGWTVRDLTVPSNLQAMYEASEEGLKNLLRNSDNSISEETENDLINLLDNWEEFSKFHNKYNSIVNTTENSTEEDKENSTEDSTEDEELDGDAVDQTEEEEFQGKEFDKLGNEESPFSLLDKNIKILFRILPKSTWFNNDAIADIDSEGLITTTNYMNTYNLVLSRLAGTKNEDEFKSKLLDENLHRVIPEMKFLANLLGLSKVDGKIDSSNVFNSLHRIDQWLKFYQGFSHPEIQIYSTLVDGDGNVTHVPEIRGNKNKIEAKWINNFYQVESPYVTSSAEGRKYLSSIPPYPKTTQEKIDFFSLLGINFTYQNLNEEQKEGFETLLTIAADRIHTSLASRLEDKQVIYDPIKELRNKFNTALSERRTIADLVNWESNFSNESPSLSFNNSMGEKQYAISLDNQLSVVAGYLNSASSIQDLFTYSPFRTIKNNPQFKYSRIINFLFDENGQKRTDRKIHLENYNGLKQKTGKKYKSTIERSLSESQKFIQDFNNTLKSGFSDVMRTETSHSFYAIGMEEKGKLKPSFLKGFDTSFLGNKAFSDQMFNYLQGEVKRINSYEEKKKENPTLPSTFGDFTIFSFLEEEVKESLKQNPDREIFLNALNNSLQQEVEDLKDIINRNSLNKFIDPELLKDNTVDGLLRAFTANNFIQNVEFSTLFAGDAWLFNKENSDGSVTGDMHKRLKGLSTTGNLAATLGDLQKYFNENPYELAFAKNYALNPNRRDNSSNFQTKTLKEYKPTLSGDFKFDYTRPELRDEIRNSISLRDNLSAEQVLEKYPDTYFDNLLKEAKDQKPADGEGYINLDFHRELAFRHGYWSPEIELAYKYEGLIYKQMQAQDKKGPALSNIQLKTLAKLEKIIFENPDNYSIPVLKILYYGGVENISIDARAYDKFSVFPILPSIARNHPKMKEALNDMVSKNYGYVKYKSGTKLFTTEPVELSNIKSIEPDLFSTELIKEVIKSKSYVKTDTSIPTQMLKLIFSNLFNEGVSLTENINSEYDKYISTLSQIQKGQVISLLKDLGFNPETKEYDYTKLSERLQNEIQRQGLNSNISEAVKINPITKKFAINPEATGVQEQIQSLIAGIADKTLRRFKLNGGDFVLVSNANFKPLKWYKYDSTGTKAIECRISLTKEFSKLLNKIHPDGDKILTLERLNSLLANNKKWVEENKKSLTIVLDRVPTQGPNSMDFATVVEFLSPTAGNIVQLPEEIVYKSGTDFDYDKEKVITPSFTDEGLYIDDNTLPIIEEQIKLLEEDYEELREYANEEEEIDDSTIDKIISKIFQRKPPTATELADETLDDINDKIKKYFRLKNNKYTYLSNKIVEGYYNTLSSPEMFAELITPNNTLKLKPIADRNAEELGNSTSLPVLGNAFFYSQNLKVFKTYFDAKGLLGAFATDNTHQQLLQYAGTKLNQEYYKLDFNGKRLRDKSGNFQKKKINLTLLSEEEKDNIIKDGKIDVSKRDDVLGNIKQHWDSEAINATVDAAKDPWFAALNINWYNVGIVNLLKNTGHDMDRVVDFVNNPVLRKYYAERNKGKNRKDAMLEMAKLFNIKKEFSEKKVMNPEQAKIETSRVKSMLGVSFDNSPVNLISAKTSTYEISYSLEPKWGELQALFSAIDNGYNIQMEGYEYLNDRIGKRFISPERLKELKTLDRNKLKQEYAIAVKDKNKELYTSLNNQNTQSYSDELRLLAHFFELDNHNYNLRDFQKYFNFDTKKISTPLELKGKENLEIKIGNSEMFSPSDFKKMKENSIVSNFINNETLSDLFSNIFTITSSPDVANVLSSLHTAYTTDYKSKNKADERNMPKVLNNEFIFSIVQNFGEFKGKNIYEYAENLLVRKNAGQVTTASRLLGFKKRAVYKEIIKEFPLLDQFVVNNEIVEDYLTGYEIDPETQKKEKPVTQTVTIQNIQLIKSSEETKLEQENIITQLRDLFNYTYINPNLSQERVDEINNNFHSLMEEIFVIGIVQTGFNKSFFGYEQYIPIEFKSPIYQNSINKFNTISQQQRNRFLSNFEKGFKNNNPKYFKAGRNYSHRLKTYQFTEIDYTKDQEGSQVGEEIILKWKKYAHQKATIIKVETDDRDGDTWTMYTVKASNGNQYLIQGVDGNWETMDRIVDGVSTDVGGITFEDIDIAQLRVPFDSEVEIPFIPDETEDDPIIEVKKSSKKEKFKWKKTTGEEVEKNGYRISISTYPNFKAFVYKAGSEWYLMEETKGANMDRMNRKTIKDIISDLPDYIIKLQSNLNNTEILTQIGLISPTNKPTIERICK